MICKNCGATLTYEEVNNYMKTGLKLCMGCLLKVKTTIFLTKKSKGN